MAPEDDPRLDVQEDAPPLRPLVTITISAESAQRVVVRITDQDGAERAGMTFANGTWDSDDKCEGLADALCQLAIRHFERSRQYFDFDDADES